MLVDRCGCSADRVKSCRRNHSTWLIVYSVAIRWLGEASASHYEKGKLTGNAFHGDTLALSLNGGGSCADGFQRSMPVDVFALICSFLDVLPWCRSKVENMHAQPKQEKRAREREDCEALDGEQGRPARSSRPE